MSSMRNAIARRPHRERAQPESRQKWGLLEKHKDYSLRAKDYNTKKQKLNILQQKSRERHPDEFAFGMLSSGSAAQGKHGQRGNENRLSHDAVQLLKTQDAGYLRNAAQRTRIELEKAEQELELNRSTKKTSQNEESKNRIVFDELGEPVRKKRRVSEGSLSESDNALDQLDGESINVRSTTSQANSRPITEATSTQKVFSKKQQQKEKDRLAQLKADRKRRKRLQELRSAKLEVLRRRQKEILAATDQLELQRAKMAKVIGGVNKNGVKFKVRERKK